jgi:23S rRNA (cytidine1920-2'-O)/16S rRNA (cytidine1409-2'-O)-methyltransferase
MIVFDVGMSTGGFTDCVLQGGAEKVIGIDVGQNQLAPALKDDRRILAFEKINIRDLDTHPEVLAELKRVDLCVVDVSFISLRLVLPVLAKNLPKHLLMALVKPQFELSPSELGKGGIVDSVERQKKAQSHVRQVAEAVGYQVLMEFPCAIKGGDGNQEFFLYGRLNKV